MELTYTFLLWPWQVSGSNISAAYMILLLVASIYLLQFSSFLAQTVATKRHFYQTNVQNDSQKYISNRNSLCKRNQLSLIIKFFFTKMVVKIVKIAIAKKRWNFHENKQLQFHGCEVKHIGKRRKNLIFINFYNLDKMKITILCIFPNSMKAGSQHHYYHQ